MKTIITIILLSITTHLLSQSAGYFIDTVSNRITVYFGGNEMYKSRAFSDTLFREAINSSTSDLIIHEDAKKPYHGLIFYLGLDPRNALFGSKVNPPAIDARIKIGQQLFDPDPRRWQCEVGLNVERFPYIQYWHTVAYWQIFKTQI